MADEFDPLKDKASKAPVDLYVAQVHKEQSGANDDLLRPQHDAVPNAQRGRDYSNPNTASAQQPPHAEAYNKLDFTSNATKTPVRSTNPFEGEVRQQQQPAAPPNASAQIPPSIERNVSTGATPPVAPEQNSTRVFEQTTPPYWDGHEGDWEQDETEGYGPPEYYTDEQYEHHGSHKKKGLGAKMDRLVQRFPALGIFYKQSSVSSENGAEQYVEQYVEEEGAVAPQLVCAAEGDRELTADELALGERYSNPLRTAIINLAAKNETQPVDVRFHHESHSLYVCDVGRNIVEIFDLTGKLLHVIDDPTIIKFQPTALAVGIEGTIIIASHFNHRLHMYTPVDNQQTEQADVNGSKGDIKDGYYYQQFKLGSRGSDYHQFIHPAGVAIDLSDGYLYVCDRGNNRIQVIRPEGVCDRVIELILTDENQTPVTPIQIALQQQSDQAVCIIGDGDGLVFFPKYTNGQIPVEPFYIVDNAGLGLKGASGIALDGWDRIFISDTGHHRIVFCTPEGGYIGHFGGEGNGPGQLKHPCGLDVTEDGIVAVADNGNKRVQLFGTIREQVPVENKPAVIGNLIDAGYTDGTETF